MVLLLTLIAYASPVIVLGTVFVYLLPFDIAQSLVFALGVFGVLGYAGYLKRMYKFAAKDLTAVEIFKAEDEHFRRQSLAMKYYIYGRMLYPVATAAAMIITHAIELIAGTSTAVHLGIHLASILCGMAFFLVRILAGFGKLSTDNSIRGFGATRNVLLLVMFVFLFIPVSSIFLVWMGYV